MDEQRAPTNPQLAPATPVVVAPAVAPAPGQAPAPEPQVDRFPAPEPGTLRRYGRLVMRRLVRAGIIAGAVLRPHLLWLVAIFALLGVVGFQAMLLILPRLAPGALPADTRVDHLPPAAAVEEFIAGQASFDADKIWRSLSPRLQEAMRQQGGSPEALQEQIDSERAAGQRYHQAEYIGGVPIENNQRRYFYVVDVESPVPERNGIITFIFTVDSDGKIINLSLER